MFKVPKQELTWIVSSHLQKLTTPKGSQSQIFPHKTTSPNHSLFLPIKNNHRKRWEQFQQQDIAKFQSHRWRRMNLEWVPLETIFIQNPLEIREALKNQPLPVAKNALGSKKENLNSFKRSNSWNPNSYKKPRINRAKYPSSANKNKALRRSYWSLTQLYLKIENWSKRRSASSATRVRSFNAWQIASVNLKAKLKYSRIKNYRSKSHSRKKKLVKLIPLQAKTPWTPNWDYPI